MNNNTSSKFFNNFLIFIKILMLSIILSYCSSPTESKYDPPSDHTISKEGAKHKNGLNLPLENCVSCHGNDLKGGNSGVSCYECHSKKW